VVRRAPLGVAGNGSLVRVTASMNPVRIPAGGVPGCRYPLLGFLVTLMFTPLMTASAAAPDDLFADWWDGSARRSRVRGRRSGESAGVVRFAFYGRISTDGYQDPASSRRWQFDIAELLTSGHGRTAVEFFDVGYPRSLPWHERPGAAELLAEVLRPDRRFDAVVIGEYERAFVGRQALQIIPYLHAHGVAAGVRRAGGSGGSDASGVVPAARASVRTRGVAGTATNDPGDAYPGPGAGPSPRWPAALRLPPCRRRPAPEPDPRPMGTTPASSRSRPGYGPARAVDLRPPPCRDECRGDRPDAQRPQCSVASRS
jgi:hypothetical protein